MPYTIKKKGSWWLTVNTETGVVKGRHTTKAIAEKQIRLLCGVEHEWKPTGKRVIV